MPRKPQPRDLPPDLHDYLNILPPPLPRPPPSRVSFAVTDVWPAKVPFEIDELQLVEAYLETVLAELLGPLP